MLYVHHLAGGEQHLAAAAFHLPLVHGGVAKVAVEVVGDDPLPGRLHGLERAAPQCSVHLLIHTYIHT